MFAGDVQIWVLRSCNTGSLSCVTSLIIFMFNTHIASWKLMAFWPATALSWGLHLMLMISSSGSLRPRSTGYLTSRHSHVSPCSSHSRTPHSSSSTRSTRYTSWRVVAPIWQAGAPVGASSSTGGAVWPGGSLSTEEKRDWESILRQWISVTNEELLLVTLIMTCWHENLSNTMLMLESAAMIN